MNETIRTILFRRSVRAYTDEPVPAELLDTILNCGIYAPSGGNHQEITLTALMNPSHIEALRMLVWQEFKKMEPKENQYMNIAVNNARTKKDYNFTFHAPVLVIASAGRLAERHGGLRARTGQRHARRDLSEPCLLLCQSASLAGWKRCRA